MLKCGWSTGRSEATPKNFYACVQTCLKQKLSQLIETTAIVALKQDAIVFLKNARNSVLALLMLFSSMQAFKVFAKSVMVAI
jgi:hypothetical protein